MFIKQRLFNLRGLRIELLVGNNNSYRSFFYTTATTASLGCNPILKLSYSLDVKGKAKGFKDERLPTDIESKILLSQYDMHGFKRMLRDMEEYLEMDYYQMVDKLDSGIVPVFNEGFEDFEIKLQNSSEKEMMLIRPVFSYNRKDDFYVPSIQFLINRDDVAVTIPIPKFLSIVEQFRFFDLHLMGNSLVAAYSANMNSYSQKRTAEKAATFKNQGVTEIE